MLGRLSKQTLQFWKTLTGRDLGLLLVTVGGVAAHAAWSDAVTWISVGVLLTGVMLGLYLQRLRAPLVLGQDARTTAVVTQDIQTLRQAFAVLQRQVGTTIHTSESAVMLMMDRMNRVHANAHTLRERIMGAVDRSQALSADSLSRAGQHGQAVASLAQHQHRFEEAQAENQGRVRAVADKVRQLTPLVALIGDISRQTNLLAINASIEAARAGPEGAGFKVVATEVRRLSGQTAEAARQITDGIAQAAAAIDTEMASAQALQGDGSAQQMGEIAQHIQLLSDTLGDVVPYLSALSGEMDSGMATVTADIIDTLGDMQFQDINRQLLEQVNQALVSLSEHFTQIYALIDGQAPPPPELLSVLLSRWSEGYVMQAQHDAHDDVANQAGPAARRDQPKSGPSAGASPHPPAATQARDQESSDGPRIEFF